MRVRKVPGVRPGTPDPRFLAVRAKSKSSAMAATWVINLGSVFCSCDFKAPPPC